MWRLLTNLCSKITCQFPSLAGVKIYNWGSSRHMFHGVYAMMSHKGWLILQHTWPITMTSQKTFLLWHQTEPFCNDIIHDPILYDISMFLFCHDMFQVPLVWHHTIFTRLLWYHTWHSDMISHKEPWYGNTEDPFVMTIWQRAICYSTI